MAQVVECLLCKRETPSSNPSLAKTKQNKRQEEAATM
jgi:hypothetical protein